VDVVVLCKLRPATPQVLLAVAIVPNLHLIWSPTARLFTENSFPQFPPIHELGEIQREALNLTALCHSNTEEREDLGRCSRSCGSSRRRNAWTWGSTSHLGLIFAPRWAAGAMLNQSGRWRYCGDRGCVIFVLAPMRATPTSWRYQRTKVQTRTICVSHVDKGKATKTLDGERRWCGGGGIWLGFLPLPEDALFISTYYWAPMLQQGP
jgi:hypothetical protein